MHYLSLDNQLIDTVIFDFDGTLAELNINFDLMRGSVAELMECYGVNYTGLANGYILEKIHEAESILLAHSPAKSQSFHLDAFMIIENIEVQAAGHGKLFNQTRNLLSTLGEHHIKTAIITRNCARAVFTVFPDLLTYCPIVVTRDDVNKVKPDPEHITYALNLLNAQNSCSIMIGDHPLDIQTGQNAGTMTGGVLTGNFQEDDFIKAGADMILEQASDILSHLR